MQKTEKFLKRPNLRTTFFKKTAFLTKSDRNDGWSHLHGTEDRNTRIGRDRIATHTIREAAEKEIGQSVVSPMNAKQIAQSDTPLIADVTPDEER